MAKTDDPLTTMLARVDLFEGLSSTELRQVREAGKEISFAPGDELTAQGRQGGRFFLVLDGEVDIFVNGRAAPPMGPGQYLGEISVIDGLPRAASAVARTQVRTWSLASFSFRPILREHPTVAEKIMVLLCQRLRAAEAEPRTS
jgi:CRP/FNR family transcriptional regulator, cyclic AMP receptor protein